MASFLSSIGCKALYPSVLSKNIHRMYESGYRPTLFFNSQLVLQARPFSELRRREIISGKITSQSKCGSRFFFWWTPESDEMEGGCNNNIDSLPISSFFFHESALIVSLDERNCVRIFFFLHTPAKGEKSIFLARSLKLFFSELGGKSLPIRSRSEEEEEGKKIYKVWRSRVNFHSRGVLNTLRRSKWKGVGRVPPFYTPFEKGWELTVNTSLKLEYITHSHFPS